MFCNYCGTPNPDDASFCSKCGKAVAALPAHLPTPAVAAPPQPVVLPTAPVVPVTVPAAVAPAPVIVKVKKGHGVLWTLFILIIGVALLVLVYPLRNGSSICDSARDEIAEQVPPALDILSARYPVRVGLLRSLFNSQGQMDNLAQQFVTNYMAENQQTQDPGMTACYLSYYVVLFDKDQVRTSIADWLEKQLDLKNSNNDNNSN